MPKMKTFNKNYFFLSNDFLFHMKLIHFTSVSLCNSYFNQPQKFQNCYEERL